MQYIFNHFILFLNFKPLLYYIQIEVGWFYSLIWRCRQKKAPDLHKKSLEVKMKQVLVVVHSGVESDNQSLKTYPKVVFSDGDITLQWA